jgi:hypothetical protein
MSPTFVLMASVVASYLQSSYRKLQTLKISDGIILTNKLTTIDDIISLRLQRRRNGNNIIFKIRNENGELEEVSVMDKPKFFGFIGPKGSKTLNSLYTYYPELQDKEIKK